MDQSFSTALAQFFFYCVPRRSFSIKRKYIQHARIADSIHESIYFQQK